MCESIRSINTTHTDRYLIQPPSYNGQLYSDQWSLIGLSALLTLSPLCLSVCLSLSLFLMMMLRIITLVNHIEFVVLYVIQSIVDITDLMTGLF